MPFWSCNSQIKQWLPQLQAHRGYWVEGKTQNSLAALVEAQARAYLMAEIDVRMTGDQEVVLFHDVSIEATPIADMSYLELREKFSVNTLREVFTWMNTLENFKLNIEIKSNEVLSYKLEKKICELIAEFKMQKRILVSSFNPFSLAKIRFFNPKIYRALLLSFEEHKENNLFLQSGVLNSLAHAHMLNLRFEDYVRFREYFSKLATQVPLTLWTLNDINVFLEYRSEVHGVISDRITPQQLNLNNF